MKITHVDRTRAVAKLRKMKSSSSRSSPSSELQDRVSVSDDSRIFTVAVQATAAGEVACDESRVSEIREKVQQDEYEYDCERTAENVLKEMLS